MYMFVDEWYVIKCMYVRVLCVMYVCITDRMRPSIITNDAHFFLCVCVYVFCAHFVCVLCFVVCEGAYIVCISAYVSSYQ